MTAARTEGGMQGVYNFWLGLIPQFFGQLGAGVPGGEGATPANLAGLSFPNDQVARAALMTQEALQAFARNVAPLLQASGTPGLFNQWTAAMAQFPGMQGFSGNAEGAPASMPNMFAPWHAAMSMFPGSPTAPEAGGATGAVAGAPWAWPMGLPQASAPAGDAARGGAGAVMQPLQAIQKAWLDAATRMSGASPQMYTDAFERTFGGVSDALGFGPMRKLQAAWKDLMAASVAQNEARMAYAMLVQGAFAAGLEGLMQRLADKAGAGERIDSVLALLRLWAVSTEEAVHQVLQSERGLAATAALSRAGVTHRRRLQHVAGILADATDMATRRELDEAFREIQALKREVRALRPPVVVAPKGRPAARATRRKPK